MIRRTWSTGTAGELCRDHGGAPGPLVSQLRSLAFSVYPTPLTVPYFYSDELQAEVPTRVLRERRTIAFLFTVSAMAQYCRAWSGIPVVMDFVDVDSDKWMQYASFTGQFPMAVVYRREGRCLRHYERQVAHAPPSVVVTTEREARLVRELSRSGLRARNCERSGYGVLPGRGGPRPGGPVILFVGDMSYFPNEEAVVLFAHKVLPLIRATAPEARFLIVGRNPGPEV